MKARGQEMGKDTVMGSLLRGKLSGMRCWVGTLRLQSKRQTNRTKTKRQS